MTDKAISVSVSNKIEKRFFSTRKISRPSLSQVVAIVDFMEKHPELALGQLRGLEGRHESKRLWFKLTRIVNNISGPTRPMKSWVKFWADKKSTVRSKVLSRGGDTSSLSSHIDKKIYDLFLADDQNLRGPRRTVKVESHYMEEPFFEETMEENHVETEPTLGPSLEFGAPADVEERQMLILEKLVKVMSDQAAAMTQMAHASQANAQAIERLADASTIQARAIERLATTFEAMSETTQDVRNAIVGIDATMKRYYTSPT